MSERLRRDRKVGRTLYELVGDAPSDSDLVVGMVDTPELAAEIVRAVNTLRDAAAGGEYDPRTEVEAHWGGDPEAIVAAWENDRAELERRADDEADAARDARQSVLLMRRELDTARALIADLADPDPCRHDHHGYCQTHGWAETDPPCPHGRARQLTEEDQ